MPHPLLSSNEPEAIDICYLKPATGGGGYSMYCNNGQEMLEVLEELSVLTRPYGK